jgi:hypothetical protein
MRFAAGAKMDAYGYASINKCLILQKVIAKPEGVQHGKSHRNSLKLGAITSRKGRILTIKCQTTPGKSSSL